MFLNVSQPYPAHFFILFSHILLSIGATDPLVLIDRDDVEDFYEGSGIDCEALEADFSDPIYPSFDLDSPFSVSNTVGIFASLKSHPSKPVISEHIVGWQEIANLTNSIISLFDWYRSHNCSKLIRYPTAFSEGIDKLDDEVLRIISEFAEYHPELPVILDPRIPSIINILSPRASTEALRILTSHNTAIILKNQRDITKTVTGLEDRVIALELLGEIFSLTPSEGSHSASPLRSCLNATCWPELSTVGGLFNDKLTEVVAVCLTLSLINLGTLVISGILFYKRNFQIISRTKVLELKVNKSGQNSDSPSYIGGRVSQPGSYRQTADLDTVNSAVLSHISILQPRQEVSRCIEFDPRSPRESPVRSVIDYTPTAPPPKSNKGREHFSLSPVVLRNSRGPTHSSNRRNFSTVYEDEEDM
jgi:hypothetical protein